MLRIGWLTSARDAAAISLLEQVQSSCEASSGSISVAFVFCNQERDESPLVDRLAGIVESRTSIMTFSSSRFEPDLRRKGRQERKALKEWRRKFDENVAQMISAFKVDVIVLAGYMLIISDEMCGKFRFINLHPSLPDGPIGKWTDVIDELIKSRATETGAMIHRVTRELDRGPTISYFKLSLRGLKYDKWWSIVADGVPINAPESIRASNQLFQLIREDGFTREGPLLCETLRILDSGRIVIPQHGLPLVDGLRSDEGLDLTAEVESKMVKGCSL